MKRILFVDDDVNVLDGLRRALRSWNDRWELQFVTSGQEAIDHLARREFDVVVADYQMPRMHGAQLLGQIQACFPNTIRIIVSDHRSDDALLNSVNWAHQFLTKPYDVEELQYVVERACALRDKLSDPKLQKLVNQIAALPSLPELYQKIVDELQAPDTSLERVGRIISQDVAMTAKILQLVNSSFFGLAHTVRDPAQAAALIGLKMLKPLVLVVGIFEQFCDADRYGFSLESLLNHSLAVGSKAREIAQNHKLEPSMVDDAFVAGMLHDVGKLVLAANFWEKYRDVLSNARDQRMTMFAAEQQAFGVSHAEIGGYLLGLWKFSDLLVEAVTFHHVPSEAANDRLSPLTAVHLANSMFHAEHSDTSAQELFDEKYLTKVGITDALELESVVV